VRESGLERRTYGFFNELQPRLKLTLEQNRDGYLITAPRALTVVSLWSFQQLASPSDTGPQEMITALKRDSKQVSTRNNGKQSTRDRPSDIGRHRPEDDALSRRSPDDLVDRLQDMRISRTNIRDRQLDVQEPRYTPVC
jgi:hypothetical protein